MTDKRTGKQRRATRKQVVERIAFVWERMLKSRAWSRNQWVEWLKKDGLIAPSTLPSDCRTVNETLARLKEQEINEVVPRGLAPNLEPMASAKAVYWHKECERMWARLRAKDEEINRLQKAALANAAERDEYRDLALRLAEEIKRRPKDYAKRMEETK